MGDSHVFNVHWESFIAAPDPDSDDDSAETLTPGPLASPAVRAVLVVYLLAMVGLAVWLMGSDAGNATSPDDWPALKEAYEEYQVEHVPEEERADRMERAALLLRRVRAMTTQGLYYQMIPVCRDIMAVDGDIQSPLFEYGAQCLATANVEGYE